MTIQLHRYDQQSRTWPDEDRVAAFLAFWTAVLGPCWDPESNWHAWSLSLPEGRQVRIRPGDLTRAEILALTERCSEPGFCDRMARLHAAAPHVDRIDPAPFLAIEPSFPRIEDRLAVLRRTLGLTALPRHLGTIDAPLPRPADATFTVTTRCASHPNGAGSMTLFEDWRIDVHAPVRVHVAIEASHEQGTPTQWSMVVSHESEAGAARLLEAFRAAGLHASARPGRFAT